MPPGVFKSAARLAGQRLPGLVRDLRSAIDEGVDTVRDAFASEDKPTKSPIAPRAPEHQTATLIVEAEGATCGYCEQAAHYEDDKHHLVPDGSGVAGFGCGVTFVSITSVFLAESQLEVMRRTVKLPTLPYVPPTRRN